MGVRSGNATSWNLSKSVKFPNVRLPDLTPALVQTSSHSLRTVALARNSAGEPSNTMAPCPIT
jgi:hypothetical protein